MKKFLSTVLLMVMMVTLCSCTVIGRLFVPVQKAEKDQMQSAAQSGAEVEAEEEEPSEQTPRAVTDETILANVSEMLNGLPYQYDEPEVDQWSDKELAGAVYGKLLWQLDEDGGTQHRIDEKGNVCLDRKEVEKTCRDLFGRNLPTETGWQHITVVDDEVLVMQASGMMTLVALQDCARKGERLMAVGTVSQHSIEGEFIGYFEAIFAEESDSSYGYILTSFRVVDGNQSMEGLSADASSYLVEEGFMTHYPKNVLDGKKETSWVEGVDGLGLNEWVRVLAPEGGTKRVNAVKLALGYQATPELLQKNGYPGKLLIECDNGYRQEAEFYGYNDVVVLESAQSVKWIRFTILEAAEGNVYEDVCISDIELLGLDPDTYFEENF